MRRLASLLAAACLLAAVPASARQAVDAVGRTVTLPERPRRVVSLAPNITEILFAVGAGDLVAGVTEFCDYPPEAVEKPKVGGFVNPSLEAVVALKPDLVLATADGNRPADVLRLERLGVTAWVIDTRTVPDILAAVRTIGTLVDRDGRAAELVAAMERRHAEVLGMVADGPRPRVLFLAGWSPLVGVGPGTFLHHLLVEAGGENVLASSAVKYPLLSAEGLLAADPEVIVVDAVEAPPGELKGPPGWERLRAVREGRVHRVNDDTLLRPGPRIMEGLALLAGFLHPAGEEAP